MRTFQVFIVFTIIILILDLYAFRGLRFLVEWTGNSTFIKWFPWIFWSATILIFSGLIWTGTIFRHLRDPKLFYRVTILMGIFLMIYFPKIVFNLFQLLSDLFTILSGLISKNLRGDAVRHSLLITGGAFGMILFFAFAIGMLRGKTNVKVFREEIKISGLPESFNRLKIVQLSDLHLAGFHNNPDHIRNVVEMTNKLGPDLIMFTGDMVNNFAEELDPFIEILNQLKAPLGKFAILGNHDYGHYHNWHSEQERTDNLEILKHKIRDAGFDLLLNENRTIAVNGETIDILGIENWGKPPFPQYGDLQKAKEGMNHASATILMSHDPSHWDLQVKDHEDIDLTLSGHTHGMQFGIEIGKFRWSPSKWNYREWAGLYEENGKFLYVNRGLGFTGFPGRVGIRPEITLLTLRSQ